MSDIKINNITDKSGSSGPVFTGITTVSSTAFMVMPSGPTAFRTNDTLGRGRAVFGGGYGPSSPYPNLKTLDMVNITTTGDAVDFGDLTVGRSANTMGGSATRGIFAAGRFPGPTNALRTIDYVTFTSSGGANDFGDLHYDACTSAGFSDATRGIFSGGYDANTSPYPRTTAMGFITIATTGTSSVFGDCVERGRKDTCFSNSTRGFTCGGNNRIDSPSPNTEHDRIEMTIIQTTGSTVDFGEFGNDNGLTGSTQCHGGAASQTRGIIFSGKGSPSALRNVIEYLTLATFGNSQDFGDMLTSGTSSGSTATGNNVKGVVKTTSANNGNVLEQVTIASTGNATDFGDLNTGRRLYGAVCDSHGGLG